MHKFSHTTIRWAALVTVALLLVACGGDESDTDELPAGDVPTANYDVSLVEQGERNFSIFCTACHGPDAEGIQGLGPSLLASDFVNAQTDDELLAFVIEGRAVDHRDNATGIAMPPRGGYPNLSDEQITSIIAFLRTTIAEG
jgi:disulfide bond formation protein DsbB